MLRRLNDSLPGLVLGIVLYGVILQLTVVWFVSDKIAYTIGLWYGTAIAVGTAINLASVIYDCAACRDSVYAQKRAVIKSVTRYLVITVLLGALGYFRFGNLLAAIAGIFGLKLSAYMQPIMAVISHKLVGDNWMYPEPKEPPHDEIEDSGGINENFELNKEVRE